MSDLAGLRELGREIFAEAGAGASAGVMAGDSYLPRRGPQNCGSGDNSPSASHDLPPGHVIKRLRASHHKLAKCLAAGMRPAECQVETGYCGSRISVLQSDPAFQELIEHYKAQVDEQYIDYHGRLATLGVDALESLHEDLLEDRLTPGQKIKLMEASFDRSVAPSKSAGRNGGASQGQFTPNISINFIKSEHSATGTIVESKCEVLPMASEAED